MTARLATPSQVLSPGDITLLSDSDASGAGDIILKVGATEVARQTKDAFGFFKPIIVGANDTPSYIMFKGNSTLQNTFGFLWEMGIDTANTLNADGTTHYTDFFFARAVAGGATTAVDDWVYAYHGGSNGPSLGIGRTAPSLGNANCEMQLLGIHALTYDTLRLWGISTQTGDILGIRKQDGTRILGAENSGAVYLGQANASTKDLFLLRSTTRTLRIARDNANAAGARVSADTYTATEGGDGFGFLYNPATATGSAFKSLVGADANPKFTIDPSGAMAWGAGGASATDTTLSRVLSHQLKMNGVLNGGKHTPTYGTSVDIYASAGEWSTLTVTDGVAFTINAPTNPPDSTHSQQITVEVYNNSGGAMGVITWNAAYVFNGFTWTNPASTKKRAAVFQWNGTTWICVSVTGADY